MPTTTSTLTYLEGEIKQNENFVSGWNYTFSISPPLPQGFELNDETGAIMSVGNSTFGVSRHNVTAIDGQYTATVEVTMLSEIQMAMVHRMLKIMTMTMMEI